MTMKNMAIKSEDQPEDLGVYLKNLLELFLQRKQDNRTWESKMTTLLAKLSIGYEKLEKKMLTGVLAIDIKAPLIKTRSRNSRKEVETIEVEGIKAEVVDIDDEDDFSNQLDIARPAALSPDILAKSYLHLDLEKNTVYQVPPGSKNLGKPYGIKEE